MAGVVAAAGAAVCLMHMQGTPRTMQDDPRYDDVVAEIVRVPGRARVAAAVEAGIDERRICIDPGIGFGKTVDHNLRLLQELDALCVLGRPVVVGVSRKRFLGTLTGRPRGRPRRGDRGRQRRGVRARRAASSASTTWRPTATRWPSPQRSRRLS